MRVPGAFTAHTGQLPQRERQQPRVWRESWPPRIRIRGPVGAGVDDDVERIWTYGTHAPSEAHLRRDPRVLDMAEGGERTTTVMMMSITL